MDSNYYAVNELCCHYCSPKVLMLLPDTLQATYDDTQTPNKFLNAKLIKKNKKKTHYKL